MEILYIFSGFILGTLVSWLTMRLIMFKKTSTTITDKKVLEEKLKAAQEENLKQTEAIQSKEEKIIQLNSNLSAKEADFRNLEKKINEQKEELKTIQEKFRIEFKNLANEILEEKTKKFTLTNKENIDQILKPLNEKIRDFEKKVEETYEKGLKDQTDLKTELKRLHELSLKLDEDAKNLTNALRSDTKKQGNWGEIVLERVLERSGLTKGQEYYTQSSARNEEGDIIRPDVVINLPDNKHIVIDSKVSLIAYESYFNTDDPAKKEKYLKHHLDSIKTHIKTLSEKNYQHALNIDAPDFVLLFMPIESAFSLAIQAEPDLFNYAWEKKIVIVSPTTLLATLRTVASIWKHEKQTQNALEIARQGGALYDKFVLFMQDLEKMGNQLNTLQKTYDDAYKKVSTGRGNLINSAEKLRKLGAKASKQLPKPLFEDEQEEK